MVKAEKVAQVVKVLKAVNVNKMTKEKVVRGKAVWVKRVRMKLVAVYWWVWKVVEM
jgi:hypothetical protein